MKLEVFFDYLCEFCEMGHHRFLMKLLPEYPEVVPVWRPCEAHPRLEEPWGRHSDLAIQGLLYVIDRQGNSALYNEILYNAVYRFGKNIEDWNLLADAAEKAGIDPQAFLDALKGGEYRQRQLDCNRYAYSQRSIKAVPTFILENGRRLDSVLGVGVTTRQLKQLLDSAGNI